MFVSTSASLFIRVIAWLYDLLLVGVPIVVIGITLFNFESYTLFFFIIAFTMYATATPVLTSGFTLGKRIVGVQIIAIGSDLTIKTVVIRHVVVGFIYILSCGVALLISMLIAKSRNDKRALHDLLARTTVIYSLKR